MLKLIIAHVVIGGTCFIMGCNVALAWNPFPFGHGFH